MLYDSEIARRTPDGIEIRQGSLRVRWELNDLTSADGHTVNGVFGCTVRGLDNPTERKMLEEALLSSRAVATTEHVVEHFAVSIRAAARDFSCRLDASDLLSEQRRAAFIARLMEAGGAVAFGCGLELLPPTQLDLDSPSLRESRRASLAREQAKHFAEQRVDLMHKSAELFQQFEAIRKSAPQLSTAQVLARVGISDQGELIRSLLMASAEQSAQQLLWAAAGPYLIRIEPREDAAKTELIPLPPTLGPLRSVQAGQNGSLLLGARGGVMLIDPAKPDDARIYCDPQVNSALGFNTAVIFRDQIWATHGEAGLVCWDINDPQKPPRAIRPRETQIPQFSAHNLALAAGRLLLTSGKQVLAVSDDGAPQAVGPAQRDEIVAIIPRERGVLVIGANAELCAMELEGSSQPMIQKRGGRITAAAAMPWIDETRILLATEDGPILCASFDDELLTHYSSSQSPRILSAAAGWVAAVNADRQRLILWRSWDGRKPAMELHLAGLAKHRVADIAFA